VGTKSKKNSHGGQVSGRWLPFRHVRRHRRPDAAQVFPATIDALAQARLARSPGWTLVLIEKPFGHDLASARQLKELVHHHFDETQAYRIDHYLAKDTVQNLLAFRFGNALFESARKFDPDVDQCAL
jgi:hypothetical protein